MRVRIIDGDDHEDLENKINVFLSNHSRVVNVSYSVEARPHGAYHYAMLLYNPSED